MFIRISLVGIAIFFIVNSAFGQDYSNLNLKIPDSTSLQMLTLQDGSELVGRITTIDENEITFQSGLGSLKIPKSKVREIKEIPQTSIKKGKYWFENPNATRLFFSPTAQMLKKGQGYFSDYYIFFPGFSYGLTNNITIGGGMSLFPGISLGDQALFFTPKIGLATSKKTKIAAGALIISIPREIGDDDIPTIGVLYGVGTYGGPDGSFTGGLGYGFAGNHLASKPVVMLGGEKRLSRRISFVSENWIFPEVDNPIISYGVRFFGENMSVDLGFFTPTGEDYIFPGAPWVDFVFNFR